MPASFVNPIHMVCRELLKHSPMKKDISYTRRVNLVRKNLFGPASSAETTKIYNEELEKHHEKATKKWDFDFYTGTPVMSGNVNFNWERVSDFKLHPQSYTLSRVAHVRQIQEITSYDLLMDERADRANFAGLNTEDESCDDSQDESMELFEVPSTSVAASAVGRSLAKPKRQPKITEFMKKRKRLAQTPKKISPPKRARTTSNSTSSLFNTLKNIQRTH